MHIWGADSSFQTLMIGEVADKDKARINDLVRFSSIQAFNSFKSLSDMKYIHPNEGFPPLIRKMA